METDYTGIVNLGSGKSISVGRLAEILTNISGKDIRDLEIKTSGPMNFRCDNTLVTKLTGWTPKHTIEEGLGITYKRMKGWASECRWWENN